MSSLFSIFKPQHFHLLTEMTIGLWQTMETLSVILGVQVLNFPVLGVQILGLAIFALGCAILNASVSKRMINYDYCDVNYCDVNYCDINYCDVNKSGFKSVEPSWLVFDRTHHRSRNTKSNQNGLIPA